MDIREWNRRIRALHPLVHCITNPVTIRDCANILLACGASPIMAHHPAETAEVTAHARALVLNMGHTAAYDAMLPAGRAAQAAGIPVVLDPVGTGISSFRRDAFLRMAEAFPLTAIRGNASEILVLSRITAGARPAQEPAGIDTAPEHLPPGEMRRRHAAAAQQLASRLHCIVVLSGAEDLVCDGEQTLLLSGGSPMMPRITGSGCMLSAMTGAFLAAGPDTPFEAAAACAAFMNEAAEAAHEKTAADRGGTMTFFTHLIDTISLL